MARYNATIMGIGLLGLLCISGCTSVPCAPVIQTKFVPEYIPVNQVPAPPTVAPPTLALASLTPAQKLSLGEMAKAYVVSLTQLEDYATNLKKIVDKYAQMAADNPPVVNGAPSSAPALSIPVK